MGGKHSKQKGSGFERAVCTQLSLWITHGERTDVFWRSAMSGGRSTVARKGGKENRQAGDITAVAEEGTSFINTFYVECKHLKSIGFDGLIKGGGALNAIWVDTVEKAKHYHRTPLLIARQNRWPTIICTSTEGIEALGISMAKVVVPSRDTCMFISILKDVLKECEPNFWARGWERLTMPRVRKGDQ